MKEERKGELYIFSEAILWSLFPILAILTFAGLSPLLSLAWTTLLASLFFVGVMLYRGTWRDLKNPIVWRYGMLIAFFIGVWFYGLYYVGLKYTTPGNAALIALFEVLTTYILFNILRKEPFPLEHKLGAGFMVIGALIILGKNYSGFAVGDFLILGATLLAPFGNMFTQKCRDIASSETIMFMRSILSAVVMFALAVILGETISFDNVITILPFLLINGIVIFGVSKLLWIEGIHRISVTKAIIIQSMTPLLTLLFVWLFLSQAPTAWQLSSIVPLLLGVMLLTGRFRVKNGSNPLDEKPVLES